ncbi:hypothetical protein P154DRAFT_165874 [Amniculicola lignicola CBS 123094]|uniref:Uncharacterized protein n=1 Tax=Amniculicola lignicola CBS 123094 TaxID=1392246 RepID=A0A6A5WL08_9PLEO|nr:hypothetical protein P154DRAFT_165874 [Amniculicola lignicola CBS 123094]
MTAYMDKSTQTYIAGLAKDPSAHPSALLYTPADATTPPEDMYSGSKELQLPSESTPSTATSQPNMSPTLLLRRGKRPSLVTRISLPHSNIEFPRSPPPTEACLSPLPAANRLHAGHTPIVPRSLSPLHRGPGTHSGEHSPQEDEGLAGPLMLPSLPGDGTDDHIELKALDAELEKIAQERVLKGGDDTGSSGQSMEHGGQDSRKGSDSSQRSSGEEVEVDGVILKKPRMNFGAPMGQA